MKYLLFLTMFTGAVAWGHNAYTGGYSGAPGQSSCASSCHGGTSGTLVVTGFPTSYVAGQAYRVVISHTSGSKIVNVNATTRLGSTTTVAGTFTVLTNAALFTGADGGVYASPHSIDSLVFRWTAPAKGSGAVVFYASGFQGTTGSSSGQSKQITVRSSETLTDVADQPDVPRTTVLLNNFPNPFNPSTRIRYALAHDAPVTLAVYNAIGQQVAVLQNGPQTAGYHDVTFDAAGLPSGIYLYRLTTQDFDQTKRLLLLR